MNVFLICFFLLLYSSSIFYGFFIILKSHDCITFFISLNQIYRTDLTLRKFIYLKLHLRIRYLSIYCVLSYFLLYSSLTPRMRLSISCNFFTVIFLCNDDDTANLMSYWTDITNLFSYTPQTLLKMEKKFPYENCCYFYKPQKFPQHK